MNQERYSPEKARQSNPEVERQKRAVCLVSGGLDSAVAAGVAQSRGFELYFLFVDYGQKTLSKERECVDRLTEHYQPKELRVLDTTWLKDLGKSALFDPDTPLDERNFILEYVPFRNSIFLSAATAWAEVLGADSIFVGSSGGDHICPDNSPDYIKAFQEVIAQGTLLKRDIKLEAPLMETDKRGAVKIGGELSVPFEITWSCHNNTEAACGHCSNCISRLDAFGSADKPDPITYVEDAPDFNDRNVPGANVI